MNCSDLLEIKDFLAKREVIFSFAGGLSQNAIVDVSESLRQTIEFNDASEKLSNKIFAVFIEQTQNVIRYSSERIPDTDHQDQSETLGVGIFLVGYCKDKEAYYLSCANPMKNTAVASLKEQLAYISKLNKDELKQHFKEQRRKELSERGAGIGLIDMARKSDEPIEYDFKPIDDENTFFSIQVYIKKK